MSIIAYRNAADTATVTVAAGTVQPGFPASNLQRRDSGHFMRVVAAAGVTIQVDFGSVGAFDARFIGLFGTNRSGNSAVPGVTVQSGDSLASFSVIPATAEAETTPGLLPLDLKLLVPPETSQPRRYWRIIIPAAQIPGGVGGTLQIARLWMSGADDVVEIPDGLNADWTTRVDDRSSVDETESGIVYEDQRARIRSVSCTLSAQPTSRAFGVDQAGNITAGSSLQQMQLALGNTGEAVFLPRTQPAWRHLIGFRGRLASGMAIRHEAGGHYSASFEAIEER